MPGIRDLQGRPVEEEVSSRYGPTPSVPSQDDDVSDVRGALGKWLARKMVAKSAAPVEPRTDVTTDLGGEPSAVASVSSGLSPVAVSSDFDGLLQDLEATLKLVGKHAKLVEDGVGLASQQIAVLRQRAEQDADRLQRLATIEQALKV